MSGSIFYLQIKKISADSLKEIFVSLEVNRSENFRLLQGFDVAEEVDQVLLGEFVEQGGHE